MITVLSLVLCLFLPAATTSPVDQAWSAYLTEVQANATNGLQENCLPRRFPPVGAYRGTALLYHGYSACPQQFDEFAPLLAAAGYDVLVPLIPGMGNHFNNSESPPPRWKCPLDDCNGPLDHVEGLPIEPQGYVDFSGSMNAILRLAPAPRVVSGISVGATLAAFGGQEVFQGKALYDRQLILNPMLKGADKKEEMELRALNTNPLTRKLWFGWGTGCRKERAGGRAGICTFMVENAMAAGDFGCYITLGELKAAPNSSVAVLYDQGDPVVLTSSIRDLTAKYREQGAPTQSCVFNFTLHSMLSKWDDVGTNRWWTNELYCDMSQYLAYSEPFKIDSATNATEGNEHYCHLGCTASSCPYNFTAPVACPFTPPPSK